ncbi:U3 snoRNP protein [Xylographa carneopallida]|nr:U3 snoRNP protein [Xylographa carneopallida]
MASVSSGRRHRPPSNPKGGTESSRKHHFESFNQRIAKLTIDPIRRVRRQNDEQDDVEATTSHFRTGLLYWKDLNLSGNFAAFIPEVEPLCDSLPQVLHFQNKIADSLFKYAEKRDALSLEPVLSLIGHLAHDLGAQFEEHFAKAVTIVASLAAKHTAVEVVEWSFTCLAWLFKYLSRLLVPDLRAVYEIMAPLLGREVQKRYVTRFAAEAMSFLVKKAVLAYHKNHTPLELLVSHVMNDLQDMERQIKDTVLYQYGIMALFADSMKGLNRGLHSSGLTLYACLLSNAHGSRRTPTPVIVSTLCGITTNIIHHTDGGTFTPILGVLLLQIKSLTKDSGSCTFALYEELLLLVSTVRKGSRIQNWQPVIDSLTTLLNLRTLQRAENLPRSTDALKRSAAVILQYAPLDLVIPKVRVLIEYIIGYEAVDFLLFSTCMCELGRQRFNALIIPYFLKYVPHSPYSRLAYPDHRHITLHWREVESEILVVTPELLDGKSDTSEVPGKGMVSCPRPIQEHITDIFSAGVTSDNEVAILDGYLEFLKLFSLNSSTTIAIANRLLSTISEELASGANASQLKLFSIGSGLNAILRYSDGSGSIASKIWSQLCLVCPIFGLIPLFLENLAALCETREVETSDTTIKPVIATLINNLASSSGALRKISINLFILIYRKRHGKDAEVLETMFTIENTPLDLQSARLASMHVRRLAAQYQSVSADPWLSKAVPSFCFGLLTFKLAQLWDEAIDVMKIISQNRSGEEVISEIAFRWLEEATDLSESSISSGADETKRQNLTEFECSNLTSLERMARMKGRVLENASERLKTRFHDRHRSVSPTFHNAASQALRVFTGIPRIAETRSRRLVPLFLQWADRNEDLSIAITSDDGATEEEPSGLPDQNTRGKLKRRDCKAMLKLFGSFANPRVLFRSSEVFEAVLGLLTNGDAEVQKFALEAISTWKLEGVQPYLMNLMNLLDDSRFREEVSVFLQISDDESRVQQEHRPELMPVLLRLLYGKVIARSGRNSGNKGQATRRKAVLETLCRLSDDYFRDFLMVSLGPLQHLSISCGLHGDILDIESPRTISISDRKQVGIVTMIKDMLDTMGSHLVYLLEPILSAVLYCLFSTTGRPSILGEDMGSRDIESSHSSLQKVVRQVGLQCLTLMFKLFPTQKMGICVPLIYSRLLNARFSKLPVETAQSVSGTLQLFAAWASESESTYHLVFHNAALLDTLIECLNIPSAKDEVKLFIIDSILKPLVRHDRERNDQRPVIGPSIAHLLEQINLLMSQSPSKHLLDSAIEMTSMLAPIVEGTSQVLGLLHVSMFLLDQPAHRVSPRSKGSLLEIVQHFVPLVDLRCDQEIQDRLFRTTSSLFGYFKDRGNRITLSTVLEVLARQDADLEIVASLCTELNSFAIGSIDEPDFERRLKAFNTINEIHFSQFSLKQWRPIVFNMLYYVRDNEELAIRSSASFSLRRFIESNKALSMSDEQPHSDLLKQIVLPALRRGASENSEMVRAEYLAIMAHLIRCNHGWWEVGDMTSLLVDDDDEASFFSNILHIQHHRRLRALRRLSSEANRGYIRSTNIAHFIIPLLEHFIFDKADNESAHNLAAEATSTIGALAKGLEWPQLRALFRRVCGYIQGKPGLEKSIIKLIGVLIDAMDYAGALRLQPVHNLSEESQEKDDNNAVQISAKAQECTLSVTMPKQEKLSEDLTKNLLPSLVAYLHDKDESTVSLRVRVAVSVVKLLKLLPEAQLAERLSPILTDVCHILRSRAQESRDITRKTLVEISTLVGPMCFGFMLRELRSSLARGYQLHVLSYTLHSMLVATAPIFKPGDLDYCLPQIVAIILDDIFGATGQEKDAEEYISKMKEVKSSKSFDSMELIAKTATISHVLHLVRPLQTLLEEKLDLKIVKKIDELLRRIGVGLLRNAAVESRETLVFCFEILQDVHKAKKSGRDRSNKEDHRVKRYLLTPRGFNSGGLKGRGISTYAYKLARFSLDVLRSVLHKYETLQTAANLSGFMPVIGDSLIQAQEEVQISALRLLATIIKIPLKDIDDNATLYFSEAIKAIKNTTSTNTELAQSALKLISAILRERQKVNIKEIDIAYLLTRLKPDLEEPDRQGVTFNFLKAVLARKIIVTELYEVLDNVAAMMVTNQAQGARNVARGVYFEFIVNYPQGKERLSKQLNFLVKNLDYRHLEGRQSVMEAIHLFLSKLGDEIVQDLVGTFFVPLVMVTINDESTDCRKMAGFLLKELFRRADPDRISNFLALLRSWLSQDVQPLLIRVSLQTYKTYLEVYVSKGEKEFSLLQSRIIELVEHGLEGNVNTDWELVYSALDLAMLIGSTSPETLLRENTTQFWKDVGRCLHYPHAWVKLAAAKLLDLLFSDLARTNVNRERLTLPLRGSGGLCLGNEEMIQISKASLGILRVPGVTEELASQTVRNLSFLGRLMGITSMIWGSVTENGELGTSNSKIHEEDDDDSDSDLEPQTTNKSALQYMLERLSAILRREPSTPRAPALIPKTAALQLFTLLCSHLPVAILSQVAETMLLPLHNLTDSAIAAPYSPDEDFRSAYKALVATSQEILSLLQKKLGTTEYVAKLSKVRQGVKERREGRRIKRRLEAVAAPEKAGRDKKRKGEKKKEKRKERSGEQRGRRRGW